MNINHPFIFPNINPYLEGLQLGQVAMLHLILRGSDQVVPVTVLHDSMAREQVDGVPGDDDDSDDSDDDNDNDGVPGAREEEGAPAQQAANVDLIRGRGKSIHL